MLCPLCGHSQADNSTTCENCGHVFPVAASSLEEPKCALHPETKALGTCVRCGTFGCAQCMTLQRDGMWCARCLEKGAELPWEQRATLGLWKAWWRTSMQLMSSPSATFASATSDVPVSSSVVFALMAGVVGYATTFVLYAAGAGMALTLNDKATLSDSPLPHVGWWVGVSLAIGVLAMLMAGQVMQLFITAGLDYVALLVLGVKPRPYAVSVRAVALSMAPSVLGLIPICGLYIFPLWGLVLRILALAAFYKTSAGKATAAVFLPLIVICGGVIALYGLVIGLALATTGGS